MNQIVPHFMASAASQMVAVAINENKLDEAAEEMEKLGEKVKKNELSEDMRKAFHGARRCCCRNSERAPRTRGGISSEGSESLENGDSIGFEKSAKSMGRDLSCEKASPMKKCERRLEVLFGNDGIDEVKRR